MNPPNDAAWDAYIAKILIPFVRANFPPERTFWSDGKLEDRWGDEARELYDLTLQEVGMSAREFHGRGLR